ncbi:MAG: hypothetical protein WB714_24915 [Candidatus Sulfotelmatobacter sp.]
MRAGAGAIHDQIEFASVVRLRVSMFGETTFRYAKDQGDVALGGVDLMTGVTTFYHWTLLRGVVPVRRSPLIGSEKIDGSPAPAHSALAPAVR